MNEKTCISCGIKKSTKEFYRNISNRDGFHGRCKSCYSQAPLAPRKWTKDTLLRSAQLYNTKTEFWKKNKPAYNASLRMGKEFHEICCAHMSGRYTQWSDEQLAKEAKKYRNIFDFRLSNLGAYWSAKRRGDKFFDKITHHQEKTSNRSDANVIYLYKVVGFRNLYKVGVTSYRNGFIRISQVLSSGNFSIDSLWYWKVDNAFIVEKEILLLGDSVHFDFEFDGSSEFRLFSECDLERIHKITETFEAINSGNIDKNLYDKIDFYKNIFLSGMLSNKSQFKILASTHFKRSEKVSTYNDGIGYHSKDRVWIFAKGRKSARFRDKSDAVLASQMWKRDRNFEAISRYAEQRRLDRMPSKRKGIYWQKARKKWKVVSPKFRGKQVTIGYFASLSEADIELSKWKKENLK